jgi:hypothetical protein
MIVNIAAKDPIDSSADQKMAANAKPKTLSTSTNPKKTKTESSHKSRSKQPRTKKKEYVTPLPTGETSSSSISNGPKSPDRLIAREPSPPPPSSPTSLFSDTSPATSSLFSNSNFPSVPLPSFSSNQEIEGSIESIEVLVGSGPLGGSRMVAFPTQSPSGGKREASLPKSSPSDFGSTTSSSKTLSRKPKNMEDKAVSLADDDLDCIL